MTVVGQPVTDSATLAGVTADAGGTVTYSVFNNNTCTGTPTASGSTKTVTNGGVPDSNAVTFNAGGIVYWQASYSGDAKNAPAKSLCTSEQLTVIGPCTLRYPDHSNDPFSSVVFNESEVLRTFAAVTSSGSVGGGAVVAGSTDKIALWYNDEHALTLGVRQVTVKTSTGTTPTPYAITPLSTNPGTATNPDVGTTTSSGDQAGTDVASNPGRPMWPALFITDITSDPSSRSGDWQQLGTNWVQQSPTRTPGIPPSSVFGTWKGAVRLVDKTHTPNVVTVTPDTDPAKNNWTLGPGSDTPPGGFTTYKNEGYGAEARWNVSDLLTQGLLQPGRAYRMQFMVHDGDQNKTGGDSGEGCLNVVVSQ